MGKGSESKSITSIHETYMKKSRNEIYIALEELDFFWSEAEVKEFQLMWNKGFSIYDIAEYFEREDVDEVWILIICQMRQEKIRQRKGGLVGWVNSSTCKG